MLHADLVFPFSHLHILQALESTYLASVWLGYIQILTVSFSTGSSTVHLGAIVRIRKAFTVGKFTASPMPVFLFSDSVACGHLVLQDQHCFLKPVLTVLGGFF